MKQHKENRFKKKNLWANVCHEQEQNISEQYKNK